MSSIVWFDIPVTNLERAAGFYGALFRWTFEPFVEYSADYWIIRDSDQSVDGALVLDETANTEGRGVVIFVEVESLDSSLQRAEELGARIVRPPKLITEEAGAFAVLADPDGNPIGLWSRHN